MTLQDRILNNIRKAQPETLRILSIDHREPLITLAQELGVAPERISAFKLLVVEAAAHVATARAATTRDGFGMFLDGGHGRQALVSAGKKNLWLARPIDKPHARPLEFEGTGTLEVILADYPSAHTVKCALYAHPDEGVVFWEQTEHALERLARACRTHGLELLLETLSSPHGVVADDTTARVMQRLYRLGIKPDWWLVEAQPSTAAWRKVGDVIRENDGNCRGLLTIARSLGDFGTVAKAAKTEMLVKGFCAGRSVFGDTVSPWMRGELSDHQAIDTMATTFETLVSEWDNTPYTVQHKVPTT